MAQPYIKVTDRKGELTLSFHEAVGRGTRTVRSVKLGKCSKEGLRIAVTENLQDLRGLAGSQGK